MITVYQESFNPFQENTFVLYDETNECVIIDPGCYDSSEKNQLKAFVEKNGLKPVRLLNTHCHIDHIFGNKFVYDTYNLKPELHALDLPTLNVMSPTASKMYGIPLDVSPQPEHFLKENDFIRFGKSELEIKFTPGHAPGHVVFINHAQRFVINGDVLFQGSIGRTDFPGCSFEQLMESIQTKLFVLPDDYRVYTGHGSSTTIGFEKKHNPFLI